MSSPSVFVGDLSLLLFARQTTDFRALRAATLSGMTTKTRNKHETFQQGLLKMKQQAKAIVIPEHFGYS